MEKLQIFMYIYMFELECWLNQHYEEVLNISFQSDEANTDRPLKEYLKQVIENQCNCIKKLSNVERLVVCDDEKNSVEYRVSEIIKDIKVEKVLLPEDITPRIKELLKANNGAVYTNPDICLVFNINGTEEYETIELKSTKSDTIPGSSVQQVTPNQWVIFVKHERTNAKIATGKYLHAINSKIQFPDRSPRPQVSFAELESWNENCRLFFDNIVEYNSEGEDSLKYELLTDWQGVLARRWADIVLDNEPSNREPWFNNNLRRFILEFLNEYDDMSPLEQKQYKKFLERVIR